MSSPLLCLETFFEAAVLTCFSVEQLQEMLNINSSYLSHCYSSSYRIFYHEQKISVITRLNQMISAAVHAVNEQDHETVALMAAL